MSINKTAALPVPPLPDVMLEPLVRMALLEDLGRAGDLTTDTIVPAGAKDSLRLVARQEGVLAGLDLARLAFQPSMAWAASLPSDLPLDDLPSAPDFFASASDRKSVV